ncbi:MAG: peptidoglycan DD-metalloendopeptidase family protein [Candidatus Faecousia sp.]|nr:peptidoglycan DD-metalloendopeptidase family protein [Candidatus Faecousia sp.]
MKNRKRLISILAGVMAAIMILSLLFSILPSRVWAASSSEIRKQINALQQDRKDIKQQIVDVKNQYQANTDEIADIVARKNVIDQEIGLLHAEIININDQLSAYSVLIADQQEELDRAQARYDELNSDCKTRIRAMEEEGTISYWEVLFKANSFSDLLDRLNMVEEIASSDTRRLQELSEAAAAVEAAQTELNQEKSELEQVRSDLNETQAELDAKRAEADELIVQLLAKGEELKLQQEDLEKEDEELLAEIARKEQEYNEAKEAEWIAYMSTYVPPTTQPSASGGGSSSGSGSSSGGSSSGGGSVNVGSSWMVPCSYKKLTSPFGLRDTGIAGASTYHQGVDLSANAGTPIVASRGGTVTVATYSNSAGYYVTINHGDGYSSIYMHMSNYIVSAGQKVNQGQTIGYVGKSGIASGYHLHFGIAYNGAYVNPCSYVSLY